MGCEWVLMLLCEVFLLVILWPWHTWPMVSLAAPPKGGT